MDDTEGTEAVSEAVLRLWHAVPDKLRLSFDRHPVDDVRALETALQQAKDEEQDLRQDINELISEKVELRRDCEAKLNEAEATIERLRAALERIAVNEDYTEDDVITRLVGRQRIARAALHEGSQE